MIKKLILLISLLAGSYLPAFAQQFPPSCKPVNFKFVKQNLFLNTANKPNAKVFLFHNISKENFWLDHSVAHPSASAGWSSQINADNWSALLLNNNNNFALTCSQIQSGSVKYLPCRKFLKVCALQNVTLNKTNGSYWLAENQSLASLLKIIQQRGINWH